MGVDRDMLAQLGHFLRPLARRVANTVARAVVQFADDSKKLQLVQLGVLAGEVIDGAEHHQAYGFSSVPLGGSEAVVLFPNGDRGRPLVVSISDRRHRPTGGEAGEVTMYSHTGAKVTMLNDGNIEVQPAPGGEVFVRSDGGDAEPLVKKSEFDAHTHPAPGGATSPPATPAVGTSVLKAE